MSTRHITAPTYRPRIAVVEASFAIISGLALILTGCLKDASDPQGKVASQANNEDVQRSIVNKDGIRVLFVKEPNTPERICVEGRSAYVLVLPQNAQRIQDETKSGLWLVYIWASWNSYEAAELAVAADAAEVLQDTVRVGARTYFNYSDIPDIHLTPQTSPKWLVVSDGKVLGEQSGYLTRDQVVTFVRGAIAK